MSHPDEHLWIVKSGGRILGPFSKDKITDLLKTREIVVLDEVTSPMKRWQYIKDHPAFARVVEDLRRENMRDITDDTFTSSMGTVTGSVTEPIDGSYMDDLTDDISGATQGLREIVYEDVQETPTQKAPPPNTKPRGSQPAYGMQGDRAVQQQAQKTMSFLWVMTFAIIIGVVGFVGYKHFVMAPQEQHQISVDHVAEGKKALSLGDYVLSLDHFKKAHSLNPNNRSIYPYLGALLIQVEGQTVMGRRLLTMVLEEDTPLLKQAWTGIGLAEMSDQEWDKAEQAFDRALQIDPLFFPALVNLGVVAMEKQEYLKAKNFLGASVEKGVEDGAAYILLAEALILLSQKDKDDKYLSEAQRLLQDYLKNSFDYSQEASFVSAYIDFLTGDKQRFDLKLVNVLDMDPHMTSDHRHNLFIHRERANWPHLLAWCNQIVDGTETSARLVALHSLCLLKGDKGLDAKMAIDTAVSQAPKDPLIQALYAYILQETGLDGQSSVALGRANEIDRKKEYKLPLLLQGRFCQSKRDSECARSQWSSLMQSNSTSLPALAGMAEIYLTAKNFTEAQRYLVRGIELSPEYKPFLSLRWRAQEEGIVLKQ